MIPRWLASFIQAAGALGIWRGRGLCARHSRVLVAWHVVSLANATGVGPFLLSLRSVCGHGEHGRPAACNHTNPPHVHKGLLPVGRPSLLHVPCYNLGTIGGSFTV